MRDKIFKEILKLIRDYIKENEKLNYENRVLVAYEIYAKISLLREIK